VACYAILIEKGNPWSAGKAMTFFVVLIPIILACWTRHRAVSTRWMLVVPVLGWIVVSAMFAGARISHAATSTDFVNYISGHGAYRLIHADQIEQANFAGCARGSRVAVFDISDWAREYRVHLAEGNGFVVVTGPSAALRDNSYGKEVARAKDFDCAFADREYFDARDIQRRSADQQVFAPTHGSYIALAAMGGGYGLETDPTTGQRFVYAGSQDVRLTVIGKTSKYGIVINVCPVAPREQREPITVFIDAGNDHVDQFSMTNCVTRTVKIEGRSEGFSQQIRISSVDSRIGPSHIGADPRDLRLRVEPVEISLVDN
jgi:hypothetical protein